MSQYHRFLRSKISEMGCGFHIGFGLVRWYPLWYPQDTIGCPPHGILTYPLCLDVPHTEYWPTHCAWMFLTEYWPTHGAWISLTWNIDLPTVLGCSSHGILTNSWCLDIPTWNIDLPIVPGCSSPRILTYPLCLDVPHTEYWPTHGAWISLIWNIDPILVHF